jgi:peptidoglycan/LPS O-acetylase OafA/YrhL
MTYVTDAPPKQARFVELDSLRGLAALAVVLHHLRLLWEGETQPASTMLRALLSVVNPLGNGAVILFFVLSGFVLSLPMLSGRPQTYLTFVVRRVFRIYLPYLAALAASVGGAYWLHGMDTRNTWWHFFWSEPVNWQLVWQHVRFLGVYDTRQFNSPIWSLVHEMRISLIFPFLCALVLRFSSNWSLVIGFGLTVAAGIMEKPPFQLDWQFAESIHIAGLFVLGTLLARERVRLGGWFLSKPLRFVAVLISAGVAGLSLYLFAGLRLLGFFAGLFPDALTCTRHWFAAIVAGGLMIISISSVSWKRALSLPPMRFLGEVSYSLYLWHFVVMLYCVHLLYGKVPLWSILCLSLALSLLVAWWSYRWIEVPSMNAGRRLSNAFRSRVQSLSPGTSRSRPIEVGSVIAGGTTTGRPS